MNSFKQLSLHSSILQALAEEGYQEPTPIQLAAIPEVLAGKDLLATAQTGTGKTAAFALPMLHLLKERSDRSIKHLRALILTPTRELALQIEENFRAYGRHLSLRATVVMGGVNQGAQVKSLRRNPDILIATPGRLLDLMDQGHIRLDRIEMFVLDEADRMLDMGFIKDVRQIASELPSNRQTLFFSATLSDEIMGLASGILHKPARVSVTPAASVATNIAQKVLFVDQANKRELLTGILKGKEILRALVFTRTKHRADRIMKQLTRSGIPSEAIHSNKSQNARQKALADFDRGRVKVLVGTDIVSRGIDVDGISHVINYEMPNDPESYVHRIGRTARAGAAGIALSFCDAQELPMLKGIEKLTRSSLPILEDHPFHSETIAALSARNGFSSGTNGNSRSRQEGGRS
ncbi:MAG: DEAD/DEAH box helicase, partial [bacterium]|nr:DEAD/DEAH box helicase [bacterium]